MRKDEIKLLKKSILISILIIVLLICFFSYLHYRKYHYIYKGNVIAKVDDFKIYEKDIETRMAFLAQEINKDDLKMIDLDSEMLKALLLETYTKDTILKLAKKKGLFKKNQYKFLAKEYYERLIKEDYINNYVFNTITEEELKNEYNRLIKIVENKEERKISHILVATEEEINRIKNIIVRKNNFEKMAEQKSLDKASAINGGSIGYIIKEEIKIPEFADIAFLLKVGELSKPIQTKEGWHIIRVDDIRKIKIKTYEESKRDILEKLRKERFDDFLKKILKNKDIRINILDKNNSNKNVDINSYKDDTETNLKVNGSNSDGPNADNSTTDSFDVDNGSDNEIDIGKESENTNNNTNNKIEKSNIDDIIDSINNVK